MAGIFEMVSGLGRSFGGAYSAAREEAQAEETPLVLSNLQTAVAAARGGGSFGDMARSYKAGTAPAADASAASPSLPTFAQGTDIGRYASAIQSNESGGKYGIVGPTHKKYGRALGAYQVMESNLPSWSKEAVGREVSPEEFLRSPQIQDAVFQTKFGQSVAKYGNPQDAASVWFTGRPLAQGANAKDVLGTTGAEYVRRFNGALGKAPAGTAPALPATAMQMPTGAGGRKSPTQVASAEPDAANLPAVGARPAGFVVPEGGAATAAPQSSAGFGGAGGGSRMTPELQSALNAAWKNPNTRAVASQIFAQMLKGQDSGWKFEGNVNGQAAWINERDGRVLPIGERKTDLTGEQRNYQTAREGGFAGSFQDFLDNQRRPLTPTIVAAGSTLVGPNGKPLFTAPKVERDEGDKVRDQVAAREAEAERLGLPKGSPTAQTYALTGKIGRDQELSATDKKAIMEAEESVLSAQNAIEALNQAKTISPKAYVGPTAGIRGYATSLVGSEAGEATQEMENIVSTNALGQLKAIFGGNPTEGERKILLQIQGSASQPDAVRQKIFDRGIALAQRRLEFNQRRAEDLKGGTFYKAEGKDAPRASGSPPSLPVKVTPSMKPEDIVKRFPSGTRLILPDGSEGRVP